MSLVWFRSKKNKIKENDENSFESIENSESTNYYKKSIYEKKINNCDCKLVKKNDLFTKLKKKIKKTRKVLSQDIEILFNGKHYLDDKIIEGVEEALLVADVGVDITAKVIEKILNSKASIHNLNDLKSILRQELLKCFDLAYNNKKIDVTPYVVMIVGINGVGKTTTVGKLALMNSSNAKKVLIAAADTFRAAALEQVTICAERAGAEIIGDRSINFRDPAAVAYDSVSSAISRGIDLVLIDTAGRLHTNKNLMNELKKISKSVNKKLYGAPHEVFLILDATTGQNAINQVNAFKKILNLTGIILTKLDGTSKGGVVINIAKKFNIPIRYIGVGEKLEDLHVFNPEEFVKAIF